MPRFPRVLLLAALCSIAAGVARAQDRSADSALATRAAMGSRSPRSAGASPALLADEDLRLAHTDGAAPTDGFLLRAWSTRLAGLPQRRGASLDEHPLRLTPLLPTVDLVHASALPAPGNDGLLWSGRSASTLVRGGGVVAWRNLTLVLAPELTRSANDGFQIFPARDPAKSTFASPFYTGKYPADLPLRFGDAPLTVLDLGQSSLTARFEHVAVGLATENQWWGPGLRTALVMSSAAPGIPHAFLRSARPLRSPVGDVEFRWIVGGLTESLFFDRRWETDHRSLSGIVATLRVPFDTGLTVGMSRVVWRPVIGRENIPLRAADALLRWNQTGIRFGRPDSAARSDQLISFFGRWVFPEAGFEMWGEWARQELPRSPGEFLLVPHHSQAWLLGLQRVAPAFRAGWRGRFQAELSYLEQSVAIRGREPRDFYTSVASPHGWTQRGQPIGAWSGPGSSTQWIAWDLLTRRADVGLFAQRVRWNNDALYRQRFANFFRHDVSLMGGLRGGVRAPYLDVAGELTLEKRLNYLFQGGFANPGGRRTVDVDNVVLRLQLTPRGR